MPRGNPVNLPPGSNDTRSKLHGIATPVCPPARDDVFSFRRHFYCQLYPLRRYLSTDDRLLHKAAPGLWKKFWCRSTLCSSRFRTANRRIRFDFPCHCEERSDVAIRSPSVPFGDGPCFAWKGMRIATAFGLAMTRKIEPDPSFGGATRTPREGCPYRDPRRERPPCRSPSAPKVCHPSKREHVIARSAATWQSPG